MRAGVATEGILVVDKPTGPTSHDMVAQVRRLVGVRRVGHCGTLDPLASGVLVVCIGRLTRLSEWLSGGDKEYESTFRLGGTSDTDDACGNVVVREPARHPTADDVAGALAGFRGVIEQVPPVHSAVKVGGVRSYERARRHQPVSLTARRVRIDRLEVIGYRYPDLSVRIACGRGTYIRSLARDLGSVLGCGAYVTSLRRCRVGTLGLEDAVSPALLGTAAGQGRLDELFVEPRRALQGILRAIDLDAVAARAFVHGRVVAIDEDAEGQERAVFTSSRLLGVGRVLAAAGQLQPVAVIGEVQGAELAAVGGQSLIGTVVRGDGRGRKLGFPTANLLLHGAEAPAVQGGVYAASVTWSGRCEALRAVVNIGTRPTFGAAATAAPEIAVEVHILEFEGNLYGERLSVVLGKYLRDERRFPSPEELVRQIGCDIERARCS